MGSPIDKWNNWKALQIRVFEGGELSRPWVDSGVGGKSWNFSVRDDEGCAAGLSRRDPRGLKTLAGLFITATALKKKKDYQF